MAYPPLNLWFLSWFSFIPLLRKARGLSFKGALRRGWWAGLIFNAGLLYWIALNSGADGLLAPLSFLGTLLVFPLYWAVFTGLWAFLHRRWGDWAALALPAIWVGLEVVKNAPEIGFPWQELGLSQIAFLPAAQLAEIGGIRLVSAWVMGVNVALFLFFAKKRAPALVVAALLALGVGWGTWRLHHLPETGANLSVLLVQGNVDPEAKWQEDPDSSIAIYENLTRVAILGAKPNLILWPETAIPSYLGHQLADQRHLRNLAREIGVPILSGAPHYELKPKGGSWRYNSAFFFPVDGAPPQRYDKIQLVPFGERVPFQRIIPQLGELNLGQAEFTPGKHYTLFVLPTGQKAAAQICFESVFGPEARRFALAGADFFCNLTNDAWYGNSSGPYQHAALVRYRAIETRRPLVRAANTGISLAVDRRGKETAHIPWGVRGVKQVQVAAGGSSFTFYTRHGELLPYLLTLLGAGFILFSVFKKPRHPERP